MASQIEPAGKVARGSSSYVLDGRLNDSFKAVNVLLDRGVAVRRVEDPSGTGVRAGDFIVAGSDAVVADVARRTGVDFQARQTEGTKGTRELRRLRIGMYQRYNGGNMDEGWTRWLLEQFGFPYTSLKDAEVKAGNLQAKYDVIVLPADSVAAMTGERPQQPAGGARGGGGGRGQEAYPPEYRSGFGREGVEALQAFVQKGATLLAFGEAGALPIERFGLPLRNVVGGVTPKEFWCPGSTLRVKVDNTNPLAYGMPSRGLATFLAGSQVYEIVPTEHNEHIETVATFVERDILHSGWLLGEALIAKKAAMVSVKHGDGRVVLVGFRPQHRAQTHGTFKLVFNALVGAPQPRGTSPTSDDGRR